MKEMQRRRLRIAYISPFNPTPSGISDYSESLLPFLAEHFEVFLFYDDEISNLFIREHFSMYPVHELDNQRLRYDLRLYQMGNSPHHRSAFTAFRTLPGVVVLHEPFLHHGLYWSSPLHHYRRELFYELGEPDWARLKYLENCLAQDDRAQMIATPLIGRLLDSALGIVVHSQTARRIVEATHTRLCSHRVAPPIAVIPLLMDVSEPYNQPACRNQLGLPRDAFIIGLAGIIHPVKEPLLALEAFARLAAELPHSLFLFVGDVARETGDIIAAAGELGVANKVIVLGRVEPLERLHQAMAACDVILNLRRTTIGETSAIALRAMALGKPVVVRDIGWFSELPDEACVKIGPEEGAEKLATIMLTLGTSPERRMRLGQEAVRYVRRECDPQGVAKQYAEFLWEVYWNIIDVR